jgi:membrane-associated phospholipid phosphatase
MLCALAVIATYLLAARTGFGRSLDASAGRRRVGEHLPYVEATWVFSKVYVKTVVLAALGVVAFALVRRRPLLAVLAGGLIAGAPAAGVVLKHALRMVEPERGFVTGYPSGHAAATLAVGLAAIIVAAPRWRPWVAIVIGFGSTVMGVSAVVIHAHRVSDVAGAYFLTTAIAAAEVAAVGAAHGSASGDTRSPASPTMRAARLAAAVVGMSLVTVVAAVGLDGYARLETRLVGLTSGLGALAALVVLSFLWTMDDRAVTTVLG